MAKHNNTLQPMQSIITLVSGKTDSELLITLVQCITDNENDLIGALRDNTNYIDKTKANIEVLAAIIYEIKQREKSEIISLDN